MSYSSSWFPWTYRSLIWQFTRREILGRYRGTVLGMSWSFVIPVLMLAVYTFVFVGVFKARWPGAEHNGGLGFALHIFAGLIIFNLFADVANRAPRLILEQPNLVKKVVFPLEILPWIHALSGLFHAMLSLIILLLSASIVQGYFSFTALLSPLILLCFLPFLLGLGWLFAALGVYLRDISQMMTLAVNLALFLSPVFYSLSALSPRWQTVMMFNPLTTIIESLRAVVLFNSWPSGWALGSFVMLSSSFAYWAYRFFNVTRKGFADVL